MAVLERFLVILTSALEHAAGVAKQRLLPLCHLGRVDLMALRDLVDRMLFPERFQRYLAFELGCELTSLLHRLLYFSHG